MTRDLASFNGLGLDRELVRRLDSLREVVQNQTGMRGDNNTTALTPGNITQPFALAALVKAIRALGAGARPVIAEGTVALANGSGANLGKWAATEAKLTSTVAAGTSTAGGWIGFTGNGYVLAIPATGITAGEYRLAVVVSFEAISPAGVVSKAQLRSLGTHYLVAGQPIEVPFSVTGIRSEAAYAMAEPITLRVTSAAVEAQTTAGATANALSSVSIEYAVELRESAI